MCWWNTHLLVTLVGFLCCLSKSSSSDSTSEEFRVGVGIADVTGPCTQIGMLGYVNPSQIAQGIHMRLYSRAFIFQSPNGTPVVYVSVELAMMADAVKLVVIQKLQAKFGSIYTSENVLLSATHTHSGPGGYMQYALYGISSGGFIKENFNAIVDGIVQSIINAHNSRQRAKMSVSQGKLENANINRSPYSYLGNPEEERNLYGSDTDKEFVQVRIDSLETGNAMGVINWFAVHLTSMNNTNKLISSDNKGYAAQLFEKEMNPAGTRTENETFVAAFGSTNLGDVSPNIEGPRCVNTGGPCDFQTSTCPPLGMTGQCIAFGPGQNFDMKESTKIIGQRQYEKARELFFDQTNRVAVKGPTGFAHQNVDMNKYEVTLENGTKATTCPAALGVSFAAGTTDGPGVFPFSQGVNTGNPFWELIKNFIIVPSKAQQECQKPKPILLDVGEMHLPIDWVASKVATQVLQVGNLFILAVPGEFTTMSGRRLREAVKKILVENGLTNSTVVIAGLSNTYTHYVATYEEYQRQGYEGASTLYGPHTLSAYIQQFSKLTKALLNGETLPAGQAPPLLIDGQISLLPPIVADTPPLFKKFGDCTLQPQNMALPGHTVVVKFVSGNPRNNPQAGGTFFVVEYKANATVTSWEVVATDADWSTEFRWTQLIPLIGASEIEFKWEVPLDAKPGLYRIRHSGYYKPLFSISPEAYEGSTNIFQVGN